MLGFGFDEETSGFHVSVAAFMLASLRRIVLKLEATLSCHIKRVLPWISGHLTTVDVLDITIQATSVGESRTAHSDELLAKCYSLLTRRLTGCGFHQRVLGEDVR